MPSPPGTNGEGAVQGSLQRVRASCCWVLRAGCQGWASFVPRMVPRSLCASHSLKWPAGPAAAPRVLSVWSLWTRAALIPQLALPRSSEPVLLSMRMLSSVSGISLEKLSPAIVDTPSAKTREVAPFLRSLRRMLENESDEILRWTSNGCAFEILDMDRMMNEVLPKYFKHRKYTSFQRQLNYFSFKKWTKSKAVVCTFSNDCFLRDRPDLSWRITRKKSVHTGGSSTPRKPRPAAVAVPKPSVRLEPVKLEPMKLEARPLPTKSSWKRDIAIRVPSTVLLGGTYGSGRQFPSPTDMDSMLMDNDVECQKYQSSSNFAPLPLSEQEVDSLEWIDNFLPSLETVPRQDVLMFTGNTVNVSAGAFGRAAQYQFLTSM